MNKERYFVWKNYEALEDIVAGGGGAALVELVDSGAKNVLDNTSLIDSDARGVTITDNQDGTYTLSGTPTATADYLQSQSNGYTNLFGLSPGKAYAIYSGSDKVIMRVDVSFDGTSWSGSDVLVENIANYAEFTVPPNAKGLYIRFRSPITAGNVDNVIVKPMICTLPAWKISQAYQPYRPSYDELIARIEALEG